MLTYAVRKRTSSCWLDAGGYDSLEPVYMPMHVAVALARKSGATVEEYEVTKVGELQVGRDTLPSLTFEVG